MFSPDPVVGDPFFLVNGIDSLGVQKLTIQSNYLTSGSTSGLIGTYGEASTITFKPRKVIQAGEGQPAIVIDTCATLPEGCDHTAYVTEKLPFGSIFQETTRRVTNFGADGCNADIHTDCDFDADFVPLVTRSRPFAGEPHGRDFADIIAWLAELGVVPV